jgi:hypothetical protein
MLVKRAVLYTRLPLSVFLGVLVLFVYLAVAQAHGIVVSMSMLRAIFTTTVEAGMAISYALRSALVFALATSAIWLTLSLLFAGETE